VGSPPLRRLAPASRALSFWSLACSAGLAFLFAQSRKALGLPRPKTFGYQHQKSPASSALLFGALLI